MFAQIAQYQKHVWYNEGVSQEQAKQNSDVLFHSDKRGLVGMKAADIFYPKDNRAAIGRLRIEFRNLPIAALFIYDDTGTGIVSRIRAMIASSICR